MSSIVIDLDGIVDIVNRAKIASDEIQECKGLIHTVSDHNDWNCKERDQVIETIENVKKGYDELANLSEEFATKLLQLKEEFEKFANMLPGRYSDIHTGMGGILSIDSNTSQNNVGDWTKQAMVNLRDVPTSGSLQAYSLANSVNGIQACSYDEVGL